MVPGSVGEQRGSAAQRFATLYPLAGGGAAIETCIYCHEPIAATQQAFAVWGGGCVCQPCWDERPGVDATGDHYATHKTVERYLLEHDGPWWVFPEPEPGTPQIRAIACVTPPPSGFCVHCGSPVPAGQGEAEQRVAGTPLIWRANHCWRCYELDPRCPETCTFREEERFEVPQPGRVQRLRTALRRGGAGTTAARA